MDILRHVFRRCARAHAHGGATTCTHRAPPEPHALGLWVPLASTDCRHLRRSGGNQNLSPPSIGWQYRRSPYFPFWRGGVSLRGRRWPWVISWWYPLWPAICTLNGLEVQLFSWWEQETNKKSYLRPKRRLHRLRPRCVRDSSFIATSSFCWHR